MIKKGGFDEDLEKSKLRSLNKMANYFYYPGCRRRFILEYFGQVPKFFWCNYCDNCCENKMVDMTDKFIRLLFSQILGQNMGQNMGQKQIKEKYNEIFTEKELKLLEEHSLLLNGNITLTIKNWKKLIETNNYINKGIPNKYLINIKKV
jgi:superfamily II DNA helicase RecQ